MIYDYSGNSPVQTTKETANETFLGFHFEDDNTYFIYPAEADKIIYNFTNGHFFKFIRAGEYQDITLEAVNAAAMGELRGYTQANVNQKPTLYYVNGRLTLQHKNCRNVGWHPRKANYTYVYGNILNPNHPEKLFARNTEFNQEAFNAAKEAANAADAGANVRLIELYYNDNNTIISRHVSRSRLITSAVPGFELNNNNKFMAAKEIEPSPF